MDAQYYVILYVFFASLLSSDKVRCQDSIRRADFNWLRQRNEIEEILRNVKVYTGSRYLCLTRSEVVSSSLDRHRVCYCDRRCVDFYDCCIDRQFEQKDPREIDNLWQCRSLGSTGRHYYMRTGCELDFDLARNVVIPDEVPDYSENRCLMDGPFKHGTHLVDMPQLYKPSNLLYKNLYCVICEQKHYNASELRKQLMDWHDYYVWYTPTVPIDRIANLTYKNRKYTFEYEGKEQTFGVEVEEFNDVNFPAKHNLRPCVSVVSNCSILSTDISFKYCPLYVAYVHHATKKTTYRNVHCALCNGVRLDELKPGLMESFQKPLRSGGRRGDLLGVSGFKCKEGQIEFLDKRCQNILCEIGSEWDGRNCVDVKTGKRACFWVTYEIEWVIFVPPHSVRLKESGTAFDKYENKTSGGGDVTHVRVCAYDPVTVSFNPTQELVAEICLALSAACLGLQIIVYAIVPRLRNRAGKILMSLSAAIFLGHMTFLAKDDLEPQTPLCFVNGILTHFFYLSSFFWMNVMAVDACRSLVINVFNSNASYLLTKYNAYVWTCSTLLVLGALAMDMWNSRSSFAPRYGKDVCWIGTRHGMLAFFVIPITIILIVNFILFLVTAITVRRLQVKSTAVSNNTNNEMIRMQLYVRLAIVLGLTWLFGAVGSLTNVDALWYPFLLLNALQGVFIFVAFTCKRSVWIELKRTFERRKRLIVAMRFNRSPSKTSNKTSSVYVSGDSNNSDSGPPGSNVKFKPRLEVIADEDGEDHNGGICISVRKPPDGIASEEEETQQALMNHSHHQSTYV